MLLDTDPKIKNITAVQLVKVTYPLVIAKTEEGEFVKVKLSDEQLQDPLFWDTLKNIRNYGSHLVVTSINYSLTTG